MHLQRLREAVYHVTEPEELGKIDKDVDRRRGESYIVLSLEAYNELVEIGLKVNQTRHRKDAYR